MILKENDFIITDFVTLNVSIFSYLTHAKNLIELSLSISLCFGTHWKLPQRVLGTENFEGMGLCSPIIVSSKAH